MAAINSVQPSCPRCEDFYYIRTAQGQLIVCPKCSCPRCHRLKNAAPRAGGCICPKNEKSALTVVQPGGPEKGT